MSFFLKFLLIAIVLLTLLRFVVARLFPWLLRYFARKMQEKAFNQYQQNHSKSQHYTSRARARKPDGKINIDYVPPASKPTTGAHKAGEFVDFEEIK